MSVAQRSAAVPSCHRCGGDLPLISGEPLLFCPHCGAPQLLLPEYLRAVTPETNALAAGHRTTGNQPPPRPMLVDWRAALSAAGTVAALGALLIGTSMLTDLASPLVTLWALGSGFLALAFYARLRPRARMNARVGARIGSTTGLLAAVLSGVVLALLGTAARFGAHRMGAVDAELAQNLQLLTAMWNTQPMDPGMRTHWIGLLLSPEGRSTYALASLAFGGLLLIITGTGGGAIAGFAATRRQRMGGLA